MQCRIIKVTTDHNPSTTPPGAPAFSISHSGSVCILACGDAANIGADIEVSNERHIDVAKRVCTESELAWMNERDREERFFRIWTWKESVMKAVGMGLGLDPRSFEVLPFAQKKPALVQGRLWYAWEDRLEQSCISVCADEPIKVHQFETNQRTGQSRDGSVI